MTWSRFVCLPDVFLQRHFECGFEQSNSSMRGHEWTWAFGFDWIAFHFKSALPELLHDILPCLRSRAKSLDRSQAKFFAERADVVSGLRLAQDRERYVFVLIRLHRQFLNRMVLRRVVLHYAS